MPERWDYAIIAVTLVSLAIVAVDGDLFPPTNAGRLVAGGTMVLGIGLLGAVAATLASRTWGCPMW